MVYQSSSLKRLSWQDQHTGSGGNIQLILKVMCNNISDKLVPPMSLQIFDFPHQTLHIQRANLSQRSDNWASKSQQWLQVSKCQLLSCFLWNEYILIVGFAVNAKTVKLLRRAEHKSSSMYFISWQRQVFPQTEASADHVPADLPSGSALQPTQLYITC